MILEPERGPGLQRIRNPHALTRWEVISAEVQILIPKRDSGPRIISAEVQILIPKRDWAPGK